MPIGVICARQRAEGGAQFLEREISVEPGSEADQLMERFALIRR
jgi:hypothetical protein